MEATTGQAGVIIHLADLFGCMSHPFQLIASITPGFGRDVADICDGLKGSREILLNLTTNGEELQPNRYLLRTF
jgi:hypothetical protein